MNNCFRIHISLYMDHISFVSPCYYQDHTWSNADNVKACHNSVLVVDNWFTKLIQNNHCWLFTTIIILMTLNYVEFSYGTYPSKIFSGFNVDILYFITSDKLSRVEFSNWKADINILDGMKLLLKTY